MNQNHIIDILDSSRLGNLSENELLTIRAHIDSCPSCNRAYQAAQMSALLIRQRAQEAAERSLDVSPFFQTRVLAAWREQQAKSNIFSFRRLWNATGALVASMAATTAALAVLTFVVPATEPTPSQEAAAVLPYSAEAVVL